MTQRVEEQSDSSSAASVPVSSSVSIPDNLVRIVVFDFDGTSIDGNSPVLLVSDLARAGLLRKRSVARIVLWAAAYKLRLPQNEARVRGLVFSAFDGWKTEKVDAYLREFYDLRIAPLFRPEAHAAMSKHREQGDVVVVVSASFDPMIERARECNPIDYQISTRMKRSSQGTYTRLVEGRPIEGVEKWEALKRFANNKYGKGKWVLAAAYGDHHSDRVILSAALQAYAVSPDRPLARSARRMGWKVLDW